jgi:hypothetical protein
MELERKWDLSVVYWLKGLFSATPVNIVDSYPTGKMILPTVSVDFDNISTYMLELGSRQRAKLGSWTIDIYAKTKSQRDEIAFKILSALDEKISVYDYDAGFPPSVTPGQIGCLDPDDTSMQIIRVIPELVEELYYRAVVNFTAEYTQV